MGATDSIAFARSTIAVYWCVKGREIELEISAGYNVADVLSLRSKKKIIPGLLSGTQFWTGHWQLNTKPEDRFILLLPSPVCPSAAPSRFVEFLKTDYDMISFGKVICEERSWFVFWGTCLVRWWKMPESNPLLPRDANPDFPSCRHMSGLLKSRMCVNQEIVINQE